MTNITRNRCCPGRSICIRSAVLLLSASVLGLCACTSEVRRVAPQALPALEASSAASATEERQSIKDLPVEALIQRGNTALAQRNLQLAQIHFVAALEREPGSAAALTGLGRLAGSAGQVSNARAYLNQALGKDPEYIPALLEIGRLNRSLGSCDAAFQNLSMALALQPEHAEVLTELGITYESSGKPELAEPLYQKVVELYPDLPFALNNLGFNYLLQGRYGEAVQTLSRAANLAPKNPRIQNNLAAAHALGGNEIGALNIFKQIDGEAEAYNNLGYLYMSQRRWEKAEGAFRKALTMKPSFYQRAQQNLELLQEVRSLAGEGPAVWPTPAGSLSN